LIFTPILPFLPIDFETLQGVQSLLRELLLFPWTNKKIGHYLALLKWSQMYAQRICLNMMASTQLMIFILPLTCGQILFHLFKFLIKCSCVSEAILATLSLPFLLLFIISSIGS
jgi:hypothetical protein